jgi:hypothetical protein
VIVCADGTPLTEPVIFSEKLPLPSGTGVVAKTLAAFSRVGAGEAAP